MARLTHIVAGTLIGLGLAACGGGAGTGESAIAGSSATTALAAEAASWTECASEDRICEFSGSREVRYGANGTYVTRILTGPVECSNAAFGDPLPGADKSCSYSSGDAQTPPPSPLPPPPPAEWTYCAAEDRLCSFTGTREVRYGANGTFAHQTLTGPIQCSNAVFGDPLPGVDKACSYSAAVSTPPEAGWKIIDLGTLGGEETTAVDINDAGSIVGTSQLPNGARRAFLFQNGQMINLGTLAGDDGSSAAAINRAGQIVGNSGSARAFTYGGSMSEVKLPFGAAHLQVRDINDSGDILINYARTTDGRCSDIQACNYIVRANNPIDLEHKTSTGREISNAGVILGHSGNSREPAILYNINDGTSKSIASVPSGPGFPYHMAPNDMNNKSEVVGVTGYGRPYVYRDGLAADINTVIEGNVSAVSALNDNGDMVGTLGADGSRTVFVYDHGKKQLIDLNTLPAVKAANWILQDVKAINNGRQIIGHGLNNDGKRRAFLLTPN
jgi:probable HAF family extracellular repeat protein